MRSIVLLALLAGCAPATVASCPGLHPVYLSPQSHLVPQDEAALLAENRKVRDLCK